MVRKVRKNDKVALQKDIHKLRLRFGNLITVTNAEWYSLFKDEIRNSIAIEGVFANRQDLINVLEHNKRTDKQKAAAILGYFEAASSMYEYANNQFQENEFVLKMADIKQIHTLLMRYEKDLGTYLGPIGDFRKNNIQVAQASFRPLDMFYVRPGMELLVKWFNESLKKKTYDEVTLAVITHVWFETIHPFSDGNGRVGRILLSYILIGQGLINVAIKGIAGDEREKYYGILEKADRCFDEIHRWLEKHKTLTPAQINKVIKETEFEPFAQMIDGLLHETVDRLKGGTIVDLNNKEAILPLRELARVYNYSQDYLRNLINRGNLKAHKKGKLWYVRVQDIAGYINSVSESTFDSKVNK